MVLKQAINQEHNSIIGKSPSLPVEINSFIMAFMVQVKKKFLYFNVKPYILHHQNKKGLVKIYRF